MLFLYSSPYVFDTHGMPSHVAGHRIPGLHYQGPRCQDPMSQGRKSQVPESQFQSVRVPSLRVSGPRVSGLRVPGLMYQSPLSQVSGPDFRLCLSTHPRCSVRQGVLRNFAKFTGKHLCQSLFFDKVAGLGLQFYQKSDLYTGVFL